MCSGCRHCDWTVRREYNNLIDRNSTVSKNASEFKMEGYTPQNQKDGKSDHCPLFPVYPLIQSIDEFSGVSSSEQQSSRILAKSTHAQHTPAQLPLKTG